MLSHPEKLSLERKQIILLGDFSLNLLNYITDTKVAKFADELYTNSFIPYINILTQITKHSEILTDSIFYNKIIQDSISGNITTMITDNLIQ